MENASLLATLGQEWNERDRQHGLVLKRMSDWYAQELEKEKARLDRATMSRFGAEHAQSSRAVKEAFDNYVKASGGAHPIRQRGRIPA